MARSGIGQNKDKSVSTMLFSKIQLYAIPILLVVLLPISVASQTSTRTDGVTNAETIVKALEGEGRKKRGAPQISTKSIATLKALREIRRTRGLTLQEREQAFEATKSLPQINLLIYFNYNSDEVLPDEVAALDELAKALKSDALRGKSFIIAGHTDAKGTAEYNVGLSLRRADAVKHILVETHGIDAETLTTIGYGFEKLANSNDPYAGENRRVQMVRLVE